MRNISIKIYPRLNTRDIQYYFTSNNVLNDLPKFDATDINPDVSSLYQFVNMSLNYSIQSSNITSSIVLSLNTTLAGGNTIRSGQYIEITDNGRFIFQGVMLSCQYQQTLVGNNSIGGIYLMATIVPSLYQLTLLPMLFDSIQKSQIDGLLGIDTTSILVGEVAQQISTQTLLDYMITNTDYQTFFKRAIRASGLPENVFLMATSGQNRDSVLRTSIDFTNTVLFQKENGEINIRQLDAKIKAPFNINIGDRFNIESEIYPDVLEFTYLDNAAVTPAVVNSYSILTPNLSVSADTQSNFISYKPNPKFFLRVKQLQDTGWFSGQINHTPINTNIVQDPTIRTILSRVQTIPDQYMLSSAQSGAKQDYITSYQQLMLGKTMGQALTGYAGLECLISIDDKYLENVDTQDLLGTCVDILNCDMASGIIATYNRSYSLDGSYISLNIVPLGSCTGYWTN